MHLANNCPEGDFFEVSLIFNYIYNDVFYIFVLQTTLYILCMIFLCTSSADFIKIEQSVSTILRPLRHTQCQCDSSMLLWRVCHVQMCLLGGSPCEAVVFPRGQIERQLVGWEPLSVLISLKALMVRTVPANRDSQKAFESNAVNGDTQMREALKRWCIGDRKWS